eukprot:scaffold994_cov226-Prasinococcus_capsulatus_cf.AAC.7
MSPVNAGFIAAAPSRELYDRFSEAVSHGYSKTNGWGGNYSSAEAGFLRHHRPKVRDVVRAGPRAEAHGIAMVLSLAAAPAGTRTVLGASTAAAEISVRDCKFCFVGARMDQGLLWYIGFGGEVSAIAAKQQQLRTPLLPLARKD